MDGYTMKLIKDARDHYEQNKPTPPLIKDPPRINTCGFDPELDKIVKGQWILVNSSELIENVIGDILAVRYTMYKEYEYYIEYMFDKLTKPDKWYLGKNLRVIWSHIRIIKQCNKIALRCYRNAVHEFNSVVERVLLRKKIDRKPLWNNMPYVNNLKKILHVRTLPDWDNGILCDIIVDTDNFSVTHFLHRSLRHIIPITDITIFEFLIMDLNLIHLPILNHEELMVEEFKELEHLIRGRCKKLKEIYDTHLIFNEKYPNFPEDCTNHILKYCQENYMFSVDDPAYYEEDCFEFL